MKIILEPLFETSMQNSWDDYLEIDLAAVEGLMVIFNGQAYKLITIKGENRSLKGIELLSKPRSWAEYQNETVFSLEEFNSSRFLGSRQLKRERRTALRYQPSSLLALDNDLIP